LRAGAKEDLHIIGIVQNQQPRAVDIITKPFKDKLKSIDIWIIEARKSKFPSNIFIPFLKSGIVAGVDPEYLCLGMIVSIPVTVLDCDLRLPVISNQLSV
jgi:hypothetical protein